MAEFIHFQYAVYMLPHHPKNPSFLMHDTLLKNYPALRLVEELPKEPKEIVVRAYWQQNFSPPTIENLEDSGHGITPLQGQALQKSKEAFVLQFAYPKEKVWIALRTADLLVEDIARKTGGLVWDEETQDLFSPDTWHETRLKPWTADVPDVSSQIAVQSFKKDELARAATLGMTKLGLPDVKLDDFPRSSDSQAGRLLDLFCQSLAEGAAFEKSGQFNLDIRKIKDKEIRDAQRKSMKGNSTGVAYLSFTPGVRQDGDPKNRLIQLSPDRYGGRDISSKQDRMLSCFFGWVDESTDFEDSPELLEEIRKERAKLPALQHDFNAGLSPDEYIQVKVPFKTPEEGEEWLWVEVTSWKGNLVRGTLESEPTNVPDLRGGQVIEIWQGDIVDYLRGYADGRSEGNTTGALIQKMGKENKKGSSRVSGNTAQTSARCRPL
jgi:uncharacterized protein YegJ (DUF2314 family)